MYIHEKLFTYTLYATYILYIIIFLGITNYYPAAPHYLTTLNQILQIYICLFLIYEFNPWRKTQKFTSFHRNVVFSAATFLLASTAASGIVRNVLP